MKKIFGIILIGLGIVSFIKMFGSGNFNGGDEILGGIIGITLLSFLPAYFLMRDKKKFEQVDKDETNSNN